MQNIAIAIILFVFGAAMGSFGCCQVWRIHKKDKSKWSHCMSCGYRLRPIDNIPIISWILLGGRCRKCGKKIGYAEFLSEVFMGLLYAAAFLLWPWRDSLLNLQHFELIKFIVFLIEAILLEIVFIYDAKWKEIPTKILYASIVVGAVFFGVELVRRIFVGEAISWLRIAGGFLILPGFYYLLYKISKEAWVGGGDWILCVALAFILGDFWLCMAALFAANVIGSIVMVPITLMKGKKKAKIPFGPFLIMGFLLIFFTRNFIFRFVGL